MKFKTQYAIEMWLHSIGIDNYHIEKNLTVNVIGSVYLNKKLSKHNFKEIPVQFGTVSEDFFCRNNELKSLKGCPYFVGRNFWCSNNQLTSLKYAPQIVNGEFDCNDNQIKSLKYLPSYIEGSIYVNRNQLTSLKYMPSKIEGDFLCIGNQLTTLEYCPKYIDGIFYFYDNPLKEYPDWSIFNIKEEVVYSPIKNQILSDVEHYFLDLENNQIKFTQKQYQEYQNKKKWKEILEEDLQKKQKTKQPKI